MHKITQEEKIATKFMQQWLADYAYIYASILYS